eukprot:3188942-Amphidinium_carterae.1
MVRTAALINAAQHRRDMAGLLDVDLSTTLATGKSLTHSKKVVLARIMAGGILTEERLARWGIRD